MTPADPETADIAESLGENLVRNSEVHFNLGQHVIVTTEDRLHLCLKYYVDSLSARQRWITPASLFATFMLVFSTAQFHEALGLSATTWEAFFLLCTVAAALWTVVATTNALRVRTTIEDIIEQLKKSSAEHKDELQH